MLRILFKTAVVVIGGFFAIAVAFQGVALAILLIGDLDKGKYNHARMIGSMVGYTVVFLMLGWILWRVIVAKKKEG